MTCWVVIRDLEQRILLATQEANENTGLARISTFWLPYGISAHVEFDTPVFVKELIGRVPENHLALIVAAKKVLKQS